MAATLPGSCRVCTAPSGTTNYATDRRIGKRGGRCETVRGYHSMLREAASVSAALRPVSRTNRSFVDPDFSLPNFAEYGLFPCVQAGISAQKATLHGNAFPKRPLRLALIAAGGDNMLDDALRLYDVAVDSRLAFPLFCDFLWRCGQDVRLAALVHEEGR